MPLTKIGQWADFHEIHADRQCFAKDSYTEFHENPTNNSKADNRKRSVRQTETESRKNGRAWSPQNASSSTS